jgi:hypothetical protein
MKRQIYQRKVRAALVLCLTIALTACSMAWIGQAQAIVAALIPAAGNIIALLAVFQGKTISAQDQQMIERVSTQAGADLQLIRSLITEYEKANAAAKPGILNQIQTAVNSVEANLNGLLLAVHIKDTATQAKITAVVGLVLAEVQSLAALLPLVNANSSPQMMAMAARQAKKQPALTAGDFVASYNATITAKTGNAELDRATAGLQIHMHGKLARWSTAGLLK